MIRGLTEGIRKMTRNSGGNANMLNSFQGAYGNMSFGQKLSAAGTATAGVMGYNSARAEGAGVPGALAQGVSDAFLMDLVGFKKYLGGAVLLQAPGAIASGYASLSMQARETARAGTASPFSNSTFVDSEQVYTMRQAGMAMMAQSKQNVRQTMLGNEAQAFHR
jgi:hypothetical protein